MSTQKSNFKVSSRLARRILLERQGLCHAPHLKQSKDDLLQLVSRLGFVQVDSVNTVERAHHMILFARNQTYQRQHLAALIEKDRHLFENWTHDASIIPTEFYPVWKRKFERDGEMLRQRWQKWRREGFEEILDDILGHVKENGPAMSRDLASNEKKSNGGWWDWHPSKTALEYLWRTGQLAVTRRENFQKVYDVCEKVIPDSHRTGKIKNSELVDWCCRAALDRLGLATPGELAAFWGIISAGEAKTWAERQGKDLPRVEVEAVDGSRPRKALADPTVLDLRDDDIAPPSRLRVISPFDPVIRDRKRLQRLFNFDYRIEIFVPAPKRKYGYYVFPLLEGDRFVGRIDMKRNPKTNALDVLNVWLEPGVKPSKQRFKALQSELARVGKFASCMDVQFSTGIAN